MAKNYFSGEILKNWEGPDVLADIEESNDEIILGIEYTVHDDDYILIKTDENFYEYGWFLNLHGMPYYRDLDKEWNADCFVRKPKLFLNDDEFANLSNEIYWKVSDVFYDRMSNRTIIEHYSECAQYKFDRFMRYMTENVQKKGIMYDANSHKTELMRYLEANNILTDENKSMLENAKFDSKIDGADGIAGKMKRIYSDKSILSADWIKKIVYKGKNISFKSIKKKFVMDRFYTKMVEIPLKQFN